MTWPLEGPYPYRAHYQIKADHESEGGQPVYRLAAGDYLAIANEEGLAVNGRPKYLFRAQIVRSVVAEDGQLTLILDPLPPRQA